MLHLNINSCCRIGVAQERKIHLRATIKDVAKRAGVSASTVSLVLNNPQCAISEKTKELVLEAVEELHYRPNQLAVSLVTKKTNIIGLIIPDNSNLFHAAYSNQIEMTASNHGYTIILGIANNSVKKTINYLRNFSDRGVDGIILAQSAFRDPEDTAACLRAIGDLRVPIVLTDRVPKTLWAEAVRVNDFQGGYVAFRHLLDLGHRRIGVVTGPMYFNNCVERLEGCKHALEEAGVPFDSTLLYEGDFLITGGIGTLSYLLGKNVTAIFAFNDMIAYGIYKESRNYNLKIPDDLSVIGFDDILLSDVIYPPLTTIEYPLKDMALAVVKRLTALMQNQQLDGSQPLVFDPVLKVRGSTKRLA